MMKEIEFEEVVRKAITDFGEAPRVIMTGKTGAGKSSIVNALLRKEVQETDIVPCTMEASEIDWESGLVDFKLLDVPGFAEADRHAERVDFIMAHLPQAHAGLLVIGAPDRALEHERQFLEDVRAAEPSFPMLVVGNKIDLLPPVRDWTPDTLDLKEPKTKKERNITTWSGEVKRACAVTDAKLALVAAGEEFDDCESQFGLAGLRRLLFESLPEAAQNMAARVLMAEDIKKGRAEKVIWANSVAAAGFALSPIPISDAIPITIIQGEMVVAIALIYGVRLDYRQAMGLLGPALAVFAGRLAFQQLVRVIPGIGSVIGAGIAGAMTLAMGETYLHFFIHGNFKPSSAEIKEMLKKKYLKAKNHIEQIEQEAKRRKKG